MPYLFTVQQYRSRIEPTRKIAARFTPLLIIARLPVRHTSIVERSHSRKPGWPTWGAASDGSGPSAALASVSKEVVTSRFS